MEFRKSFVFIVGIALSIGAFSANGPTGSSLNLEKSKNSIEFLAIGSPSALRIRGTLKAEKPAVSGILRFEENSLTGSAVILLDAFDTGMELRNKHMKDKYLQTQQWPTTELVLSEMRLPDGIQHEKFEASKIPFKGTLSLHGTKKVVSGLGNLKKEGNDIEVHFDFDFPLSEFSIETPTFMGIRVTKDVAVAVAVKGNLEHQ